MFLKACSCKPPWPFLYGTARSLASLQGLFFKWARLPKPGPMTYGEVRCRGGRSSEAEVVPD